MDLGPGLLKSLYGCRVERPGSFESEGEAKAAGVEAAGAPLVAFLEDHSYPDAGWAGALMARHGTGDDIAAVGPVMRNANPSGSVSWGCFLIYYGQWMTLPPGGEVDHLPANQSCYKRDVLMEYGPRLAEMLQAESVLQWDLAAEGRRIIQDPGARVYHLNYSRLGPMICEYFHSSRVFAANRSAGWGAARRIIYTLGSPLLPLIRLRRVFGEAGRAGLGAGLMIRALGPTVMNLTAGAAGEMIGYSCGQGRAPALLMKIGAERHLTISARDLEEGEKRVRGSGVDTEDIEVPRSVGGSGAPPATGKGGG